jgi:adenosylhomocysteine nucleosidase
VAEGLPDVAELPFDAPCVLFALRREALPFRRTCRPHRRFPGAPGQARFCGPAGQTVLVAETGVGTRRTGDFLDWLLGRPLLGSGAYRPRLVLSAGFGGALDGRLRVGDLVLATEVVDAEGRCRPTTWPGALPAGVGRPTLHRGRLLTAPGLLADPGEKRALGERHRALAVDMESAAVAERCTREGVPFGCLRAVSDDIHTALSPRLVSLLAGGRVAPLRLFAGLVRSPGLAGELWRLARDTHLAAERLAVALGELLTFKREGGRDER